MLDSQRRLTVIEIAEKRGISKISVHEILPHERMKPEQFALVKAIQEMCVLSLTVTMLRKVNCL